MSTTRRDVIKAITVTFALATFALASGSATALAQTPQASQTPSQSSKPPVNIDKAGLGIQGYDPVAYQTLGKPTKGSAEMTAVHDGVTYRFASGAHKTLFEADPAKYVPRYGGYCAYAVANGYTATVDPTAWQVVDGRLYLNYNAAVAKTWSAKTTAFIKAGDANWTDWRKLKKG